MIAAVLGALALGLKALGACVAAFLVAVSFLLFSRGRRSSTLSALKSPNPQKPRQTKTPLQSLIPWLRDVWITRHLPPYVPPLPFVGDLPELAAKGMHRLMEDRARALGAGDAARKKRGGKNGAAARHGGAFRMFVGSHVWVVTCDPESSRRLMSRLLNRFPFPQLGRDQALGGGRDLVSLRGERWRRMRLAWLPTFAPPSLALYAPLMDGCARKLAARLAPLADSGAETDVWRLIGALTLDVVGTTAFGARFNALDDDDEGNAASSDAAKSGGSNDNNGSKSDPLKTNGHNDNSDGGDGNNNNHGEPAAAAAGGGKGGGGDDDDGASPDGKRLVEAARTIFANGSLTSGSGWQALLIMFPLGTPLWKALAARFPDKKLREVDAAREVVRASAAALVQRQRRREAEAEADAAEAAAVKGGHDDGGDADGGGARDQVSSAADKAPPPGQKKHRPSPISSGVLPGSFLSNLLRPQAAASSAASAAHALRPGAEELPPLAEADAVANASLFVLAGYETTANTVAAAVYALSTTPAAQRRVCAEVDAFFAAEGRGAALTPEAVAARFPFCEAAIKEALRLYSPVTAIAREVAAPPGAGDSSAHRRDLLLSNGPALRPGITVAAANWVYQRSEKYWPRASEFLPERWVPEAQGGCASVLGPTTPSAWSPFGGGPRQCVGIKFAMLEAVVALVRLYERYTFSPGPSQVVPIVMKQALTLSPDGGVNVVVRRRPEFFGGVGGETAAA